MLRMLPYLDNIEDSDKWHGQGKIVTEGLAKFYQESQHSKKLEEFFVGETYVTCNLKEHRGITDALKTYARNQKSTVVLVDNDQRCTSSHATSLALPLVCHDFFILFWHCH